jgi:predicted dehydrogenase
MKKLRAALVGLGIMGSNHARVLSSLADVDLVAIADPQGDVRGLVPNQEVLKTVDDVIRKGVDYCVIAAPTALHEEISVKLLDAGVHVLIEKPLSHNSQSARRIAEIAQRRGLVGAVGHVERFNSAFQQARVRILNDELGEIYQISTRRLGPFPSRIADVGVVMDLATHDIDLSAWITGAKYRSVSAQSSKRVGRTYEDLVAITAKLDNGVVVNHLVNWISPLKERKTVITGAKGSFVIDTLTSDLTFYANGTFTIQQDQLAHLRGVSQGDIHIYAFDKPEPLRTQHSNFRDVLFGKGGEVVSLENACRTVEVAEAILRSCQTEKVVAL